MTTSTVARCLCGKAGTPRWRLVWRYPPKPRKHMNIPAFSTTTITERQLFCSPCARAALRAGWTRHKEAP